MTREVSGPIAVLGSALAIACGVFLLVPPIAQNPAYHDFADQRTLGHLHNFWNVISNFAFLAAAAFGITILRVRTAFAQPWERFAFCILLAATVLVAFGSAYYHWSPDAESLTWDRLPMAIVFMTIFALTLGERISMKAGRLSLLPLISIGILSVIYWRLSGDLRLYAIVQFYPMIAIPTLLLFCPPRYTGGGFLFAMLAFYFVAKMLEMFDRDLLAISLAGGHPWKHLASAAALTCYMLAIRFRRPAPGEAAI